MTLQRHRSNLIPSVDFSSDGNIFVTDRGEGTFPLRIKNPKDNPYATDSMAAPSIASFHSFDPNRKHKKRKYKQKEDNNRFSNEVRNISGTLNSASSLGRKLRKTKQSRYLTDVYGYRLKGGGSVGRRKHKDQSFVRDSKYTKSLDLEAIRKNKQKTHGLDVVDLNHNGIGPNTKEFLRQKYRGKYGPLFEDHLPFVLYIVMGVVLLVVGFIRVFVSWWHQYFCAFWAGIFCLIFGIISALHKGDYYNKTLNLSLIGMGGLSTAASVISVGIVLHVFAPLISGLILNQDPDLLKLYVEFSNYNASFIPNLDISGERMVYVSLSLDVITLVILLVSLSSVSVSLICLDRHWDTRYFVTSQCTTDGKPRFFNPFVQVPVGLSCIVTGLVVQAFTVTSVQGYFASVWCPILVLASGIVSVGYGKRMSSTSLGVAAILLQFFALALLFVGIILQSFVLVSELDTIMNDNNAPKGMKGRHTASVIFHILFLICCIINIMFCAGILFRYIRHICCRRRKKRGKDMSDTHL